MTARRIICDFWTVCGPAGYCGAFLIRVTHSDFVYSGYRRNCRKNLKKSKKQLTFPKTNAILTKSVREKRQNIWDHSSAGRASALQAEGHRFEPYWSHTFSKIGCGGIAQLARAHGSYPWCRWFKSSSRYFYFKYKCLHSEK